MGARSAAEAGGTTVVRDRYAELALASEQVLVSEHQDTPVACGAFAHWAGEAGDGAGARDQLAALLTALERAFGSKDRRTLAARDHLRSWTQQSRL